MLKSAIHAAARLWLARDEATDSPLVGLAELSALDGALEDNLRKIAWNEATANIATDGALFAAAVLAFRAADRERIGVALQEAAKSKERFREVESALGWVDLSPPLRALLEQWKLHPETMLRRLAIAGFAVHRIDPGPALAEAVRDPNIPLRARAARAVYQLARRDLLPLLRYDDPDVPTRFNACWSGALLVGDPDAVSVLRGFAERGERYPDRAAQLACLNMAPARARAWLRTVPVRYAIFGAWALADPADVPWLLACCEQPANARVAAEAIAAITGLATPARPAAALPTAIDPADVELADPDLSALRLAASALRLDPGVRHQLGRPITKALLREHLSTAKMRIRTLAAVELAHLSPAPSFEVRASAAHQTRWLAAQ